MYLSSDRICYRYSASTLVIPAENTCIPGFVTKEQQKKNERGLILKTPPNIPRNPPAEFKFEVLRRCFENGESVKSLSEEIGYSRASIYTWRKRYLQGGVASLVNTKKYQTGKNYRIWMKRYLPEEIESLRKQMYELQLEVDILKETINVLKKTPASTGRT